MSAIVDYQQAYEGAAELIASIPDEAQLTAWASVGEPAWSGSPQYWTLTAARGSWELARVRFHQNYAMHRVRGSGV